MLQKVYQQRGAGRKESGLFRGQLAAPTLREHVQPVITRLLARGYFSTSSKNGTTFYHPMKDRRAEVEKVIESKSLESF